MKETNAEKIWPEKIDAIYQEFLWLKNIMPQDKIGRAYVKRFDESALELTTRSYLKYVGPMQPEHEANDVIIYFISEAGNVGVRVGCLHLRLNWLDRFLGDKPYELFNESVRHALLAAKDPCTVAYMVLIQMRPVVASTPEEHFTRLTVYKPPQGEKDIREWYRKLRAAIREQVVKEIANV